MSRFVQNAEQLLSAAENAMQAGHTTSEMTILIARDGGIRMVADSDWTLESLQQHHGAQMAYRVTRQDEKVCIEGREGGRRCRFESEDGRRTARLLLAGNQNFDLLSRSA